MSIVLLSIHIAKLNINKINEMIAIFKKKFFLGYNNIKIIKIF